MSIFRRGPVTPSTPTFPNINLTKATKKVPIVSNVTEFPF